MKRDCLLSRAYSAPPMKFNGREIAYSSLVNEILRGISTPIFAGDSDGPMTQNMGFVEAIYVMAKLAEEDKEAVAAHCDKSPDARNAALLSFYIQHEDEIERLKPEILARLEAAAAAAVESETPGKPLAQPRDSSP